MPRQHPGPQRGCEAVLVRDERREQQRAPPPLHEQLGGHPDTGARTEDELLDAAWADAPAALRGAAALTLRAHLGKLAEGGRLPDDVRLA